MSFEFSIKKLKISVDGKKYTKNEINIGNKYMFIHYSKPGKYNGKIRVNMKKPAENITIKEYDGSNLILKFEWFGLWEDESTGKKSMKNFKFKIDFERPIDSSRVYFALIGQPLTIKKGKDIRRAPGIITQKFKSKKYNWKSQNKKLEERKLKLKKRIKNYR